MEALLLESLWENMEFAAARWARWSAVVPAADCLFVPRSFFIIFEGMLVTLQSMPSMHCCSTELFSLCPQFCCIWDTCWFLFIPGLWFHNNTIILHTFINRKWLLPPNNEICAPRFVNWNELLLLSPCPVLSLNIVLFCIAEKCSSCHCYWI